MSNFFDTNLVQVYKQCFADFNPDPSGIIYITLMPALSFGSIIFYYNGLRAVFFRSLSYRVARHNCQICPMGTETTGRLEQITVLHQTDIGQLNVGLGLMSQMQYMPLPIHTEPSH